MEVSFERKNARCNYCFTVNTDELFLVIKCNDKSSEISQRHLSELLTILEKFCTVEENKIGDLRHKINNKYSNTIDIDISDERMFPRECDSCSSTIAEESMIKIFARKDNDGTKDEILIHKECCSELLKEINNSMKSNKEDLFVEGI